MGEKGDHACLPFPSFLPVMERKGKRAATHQSSQTQQPNQTALDALGFDWGNEEAYVDLRWDIFLGTYYYWRLIKGVPLVGG